MAYYRLPYLAIVHMTYHLDFSTRLYYKFTNRRVIQEVQVNKVTFNCILFKTQVKRILSTGFCYLNTKILTSIFLPKQAKVEIKP